MFSTVVHSITRTISVLVPHISLLYKSRCTPDSTPSMKLYPFPSRSRNLVVGITTLRTNLLSQTGSPVLFLVIKARASETAGFVVRDKPLNYIEAVSPRLIVVYLKQLPDVQNSQFANIIPQLTSDNRFVRQERTVRTTRRRRRGLFVLTIPRRVLLPWVKMDLIT